MQSQINFQYRSPKFNPGPLDVQFLVLHYTAGPLKESLELLCRPDEGGSSHLVIGEDGQVFELVNCLAGQADRAWHAGKSFYQSGDRRIEGFNDFSIGIELVNRNGNIFDYTDAQYSSLNQVLEILKQHYPALRQAERIIGHEQIAGFRGKCDPGICFNWQRFFAENYPTQVMPGRAALMSHEIRVALQLHISQVNENLPAAYWFSLSHLLEQLLSRDQGN